MEGNADKIFRRVEITGKGSCLVATRDIAPLEIILTDSPAVVAPHPASAPVCLGCMQRVDGSAVCPACLHTVSSKSFSLGEDHSEECGVLQGLQGGEGLSYQIVGVLRLLRVRERDAELWGRIDKLMDNEEDRRQDVVEWKRIQREVVDVIKQKKDVEDDLIHRLVGILNTNCLGFSFRNEKVDGQALYPLLSIVSHSCVSNARYAVNPEDFSVVLRARKHILEGEEITINYVPPVYGLPKRKLYLANGWYFDCSCARCSDVTEFGTFVSALKCSSCREGLILPEDQKKGSLWRCRFCSNPYESEMIQKLVQNIENQLNNISDISVKSFETFIRKNSKDLHLKHYLNLIAQRNIIEILSHQPNITREEAKKCIRLCKSYTSSMSLLDPGYSQWKGSLIKNLAKAQLELLKIDLQEAKIDRNMFASQSEEVWKSMDEADCCDVLCMPIQARKGQ